MGPGNLPLNKYLRWFENWHHRRKTGRDWRKRQTPPDWQVAVLTSKGTYIRGLPWAAVRQVDFHALARILKDYTEALPGFSHVYPPDGLNSTLPQSRRRSWNTVRMWSECTFQRRGGSEGPLIAQVQLRSQPEVTSSPWHPPTTCDQPVACPAFLLLLIA